MGRTVIKILENVTKKFEDISPRIAMEGNTPRRSGKRKKKRSVLEKESVAWHQQLQRWLGPGLGEAAKQLLPQHGGMSRALSTQGGV